MNVLNKAREACRKSIESLYEDTCVIYEQKSVKDEVTKVTKKEAVAVNVDVPCKLSFEVLKPASEADRASEKIISVKLFISPDIKVEEGSKIVVTRNGEEFAYKRSGSPGVFFTHQEIMLEPFDRWA